MSEWRSDAQMIDAALDALIRQHRAAAIDSAYEMGYGSTPIDATDEWGDLESFHDAASRT